MRHLRLVLLLVTLLLTSTLPLSTASEGRATTCDSVDLNAIPDPIIVDDQSCVKIALGELQPGTIVEFDVDADVNFDFLVFRNTGLPAYQNDQSYRSPTYWAEDSVFEDMVGMARWHWTVPTDEGAKNWFVILDNLDHLGDDGEGAQGGSSLQVTFDVSFPATSYWSLHDSLVQLGVNSHTKLIDENLLVLDEGTQVSIRGIPLAGNPDLFILTENQRLNYLDGSAPEFRVPGADLLQITSEGSITWTVDATHANQPLWLYADNEMGPSGGGDGSVEAIFTVIIELLPVLDATITSTSVALDVGESTTISATDTPNLSNQVDTSAYEWDLDGDGLFELTGPSTDISWQTEGTFPISLRINGVDGRTDTSTLSIGVSDQTYPIAVINGGNNIVRGFSESFTLASSSTDNFGIDREEWWADGVLVQSDSGTGNSFTYSFASGGNHSITLRAYDLANWSTDLTINVTIQDRTAPELEAITGPKEVMAGEENTWRINATDPNSPQLSWFWDFDRSIDSDGNGNTADDKQKSGDIVTWTFSEGGDYSITCTVINSEGLSSTREINVYVESQPVEKSSTMTYVYGGGIILLALTLIAGGAFFARTINQRRTHKEMMEVEAARKSAEEAEANREVGREEQLSMFQNRGSSSSGFARGGGDEMAEIAGVGSGYGAQQPIVTTTPVQSFSDSNLLSAFEEEETPVAQSEPEPKPEDISPTTTGKSSVLSSGVELPSILNQQSPEPKSEPTPTPMATEQAPQPESKSIIAEKESDPETTEVRGICNDCEQQYAVDMPVGVNQAQIICPKCGTRNIIRR
ncbi:MAG: hypothetical protein CMB65_01880 [Euryarchaeota archaeon]|nr:hypothetical protein [Euryarchaeota archaeon]